MSRAFFNATSKYILSATVTVNDSQSGFVLNALTITGDSGNSISGASTGVLMSGSNGAIYNETGLLMAGYRAGAPFSIEVHQDSGNISIFKDGIIMNSLSGSRDIINAIEIQKEAASSMAGEIKGAGEEDLCVLGDSSGIYAFYYDNELFLCP